jgi:2-polyprenyl-6-methoxyphenol hydroxylase-like FAD-dependent oxidoreductase
MGGAVHRCACRPGPGVTAHDDDSENDGERVVAEVSERSYSTDVVIVGGGPTGLSLALHLDMYGIDCTLVESEPATRGHPKGNTNNARTMELFRKLGVADGVRDLGVPADHPFDIAFFTRFNGFEIARGRTPSRIERLQTRAAAAATDQVPEPPHRANQMFVEQLLFERVATRPHITRKFGCTARSFIQDSDGVTVTIADRDGTVETLRARYVVGCDGSRSLVRRTLGIKYGGEAQLMDVFLAGLFTSVHLRIPDLYPKFVGHRRAWMYMSLNPDVHLVMISLNGADEFLMQIPTQAGTTVDTDSIVARVKKAIGVDIAVEIISHRQWNAGAYLVAEKYQSGRAFLAGDAAHLYTPTGGYGLNTGIDDSSNLAWKLAAVISGWGGEGLLASYEYERRKTALRSSEVARGLGKTRIKVEVPAVAEEDSPAGQSARNIIAQSPFVTTHHFTLPEDRDFLGVILGARYDGSPLIVADGPPPADSLEHYVPSSIPGGRAPHLWLDRARGPGSSLYDHIGSGFALLRFGGSSDTSRLETAAQSGEIPLQIVDVQLPEARALYDRNFYLVRPDGYIAWCGDALPNDVDGLLDIVLGRNLLGRTSKTPADVDIVDDDGVRRAVL